MVLLHLFLKFLQRNRPIVILVQLFEDVHLLLTTDLRVDSPQEPLQLLEIQLLILLIPHLLEQLYQVDVLRVDHKPDVSHHLLHLVLELHIFLPEFLEETLEDRVHKKLIPRNTIGLSDLQASLQKALSVRG